VRVAGIDLRFLVLLLNGTNLKENENATAQPVISGSKIYPIVIGLPPLAEQHRIVAKVDALMALCDRLEASLAVTHTTRRNLLDALLGEALAPDDVREEAALLPRWQTFAVARAGARNGQIGNSNDAESGPTTPYAFAALRRLFIV